MNVYVIVQNFAGQNVAGKLFEASSDGDAVRSIATSFRGLDPKLKDIFASASLVRLASFDEENLILKPERKPAVIRSNLTSLCSFEEKKEGAADGESV